MRHFLTACAVVMAPAFPAEAGELSGIYRTESGKAGGVLHVAFDACNQNPDKTCGVIKAAYDRENSPREDYPHLGKPIIWDMVNDGRGKYTGGRMWAHEADRVLGAKIHDRGGTLRVSGCVGPICRSEVWVRLK